MKVCILQIVHFFKSALHVKYVSASIIMGFTNDGSPRLTKQTRFSSEPSQRELMEETQIYTFMTSPRTFTHPKRKNRSTRRSSSIFAVLISSS